MFLAYHQYQTSVRIQLFLNLLLWSLDTSLSRSTFHILLPFLTLLFYCGKDLMKGHIYCGHWGNFTWSEESVLTVKLNFSFLNKIQFTDNSEKLAARIMSVKLFSSHLNCSIRWSLTCQQVTGVIQPHTVFSNQLLCILCLLEGLLHCFCERNLLQEKTI